MSPKRAFFYTIIASILFGFLPLFVSLAYETGLNAYDVAFFRFFFAGAMFFFLLLYKKESLAINKKQALLLTLMSVVGYVLMNSTLFLSYQFLPVATATTIHFAYPIVVTVFAYLLYRHKLGWRGITALVLSAVGIVLLSIRDFSVTSLLGVCLSFLSAIFLAVYALGVAHPLLRSMSIYKLLFYISAIATVMIQLGQAFFFTTPFLRLTATGFVYVFLIASVCTVVALSLFTAGIRGLGPSLTCILATLEPITTIILGIVFLSQPLYWQVALGCGLILVAVFFATGAKTTATAGAEPESEPQPEPEATPKTTG